MILCRCTGKNPCFVAASEKERFLRKFSMFSAIVVLNLCPKSCITASSLVNQGTLLALPHGKEYLGEIVSKAPAISPFLKPDRASIGSPAGATTGNTPRVISKPTAYIILLGWPFLTGPPPLQRLRVLVSLNLTRLSTTVELKISFTPRSPSSYPAHNTMSKVCPATGVGPDTIWKRPWLSWRTQSLSSTFLHNNN